MTSGMVMRPDFDPRVGDAVQFESDRQTEKGPSAGSVVALDKANGIVTIKHSDHPGETFQILAVRTVYRHRRPADTFWMLE
jgi:hypothetical protein